MSNNTRRLFCIPVICAAACLLITACKKEVEVEKPPEPGYFERIKFVLGGNAGFSRFNYYLQRTGLLDSLAEEGPFTVFGPDDNSFRNISYPLDTVFTLVQRMQYHVLKGSISLKKLPLGMNQELPAIDGRKVWVTKWKQGNDTLIAVNGCQVSQADITTTNGYINVLSSIMELEDYTDIESMMKNDQSLTFLSTALTRTGLLDEIKKNKNVTLLAPDNNTFRSSGWITSMERALTMDIDSLTTLLKHHILPERKFILDIKNAIGLNVTGELTTWNGTKIQAYADSWNLYWISKGSWIYPPNNQSRVSYPANDAVLHRIYGVLNPW